jgi:hypothetical protein
MFIADVSIIARFSWRSNASQKVPDDRGIDWLTLLFEAISIIWKEQAFAWRSWERAGDVSMFLQTLLN